MYGQGSEQSSDVGINKSESKSPKLEELDQKEANEILVRSSPQEVSYHHVKIVCYAIIQASIFFGVNPLLHGGLHARVF